MPLAFVGRNAKASERIKPMIGRFDTNHDPDKGLMSGAMFWATRVEAAKHTIRTKSKVLRGLKVNFSLMGTNLFKRYMQILNKIYENYTITTPEIQKKSIKNRNSIYFLYLSIPSIKIHRSKWQKKA
jgi:hypothetical protein